jgi:hypothetical protein
VNQVTLIVWKDLRRLRWPLFLYALLIVGAAWLDLRDGWSFADPQSLDDYSTYAVRRDLFPLVAPLMSILLVGLVIHLDPLLGTRAYWMTRPVRPLALLGAKVAFLFFFLVLFPALVELSLLIQFGLEPSRWMESLLAALGWNALLPAFVVPLATLTSSIPVFLVACIAGAIAVLVVDSYAGLWSVSGHAATVGWSLAVWAVVGAGAVVVWRQYHRADVRTSAILLAIGLLLGPFALKLPWHRPQPNPEGKELSVTVSPQAPAGSYEVVTGLWPEAVTLRWGLFNAPPDQFYELQRIWGKVRLDDGRQIVASAVGSEGRSSAYGAGALKEALAGYSWYGAPLKSHSPASLAFWADDDTASVVGRTVSFEGQVQLQAYAYELAGTLPLLPGERLRHGSLNLEVLGARPVAADIAVDVYYSRVRSEHFRAGRTEFLLVRKGRLEVARERPLTEPDYAIVSNASRYILRPSGTVEFRRSTSLYPLPFEAPSDRLEDLEIQVWQAVPTEPYYGTIQIPEFHTTWQR